MISKSAIKKIKEIATISKFELPNNCLTTLDQYCKIVRNLGYILCFSNMASKDPLSLSACTIFHIIFVTPGWAANLILHDNETTRNAFWSTIGHEIAHDDTQNCSPIKAFKFRRHIKEVYCDFSGAAKMLDGNRHRLVNAIQYKIDHKPKRQAVLESSRHPSWIRRKFYAEHFDFNEELIEQIATDVGYRNKKVIRRKAMSYNEIILTPKPSPPSYM